ncbi:MAG: stress response translation initiation inhibitor YciH [Acidobacteriota bacterium]
MVVTSRGRTVYSTGKGQVCPRCGWPVKVCRCSSAIAEPVPSVIVAKLRIEKAGRGGKTVTVVDNLPHSPGFLRELVKELKRACGAGGTVGEGRVEIQGDHRGRVRELLLGRGWTVKG